MQPYSPTDILLARIQCLVALGYGAEEAARIVAETYGPPRA